MIYDRQQQLVKKFQKGGYLWSENKEDISNKLDGPKSYSTTKTEADQFLVNDASLKYNERLNKINRDIDAETKNKIEQEKIRSSSDSFWDIRIEGVESTLENRINNIIREGENIKEWERKSFFNKSLDVSVDLALAIAPEVAMLQIMKNSNKINRISKAFSKDKESLPLDYFDDAVSLNKNILNKVKESEVVYKNKVSDYRNLQKYNDLDQLEKNFNSLNVKQIESFLSKEKEDLFTIDVVDNLVNPLNKRINGSSGFDLTKEEQFSIIGDFALAKNKSIPDMTDELIKGGYSGEYEEFISNSYLNKLIHERKPYGMYVKIHKETPDIYNTVSHELKHAINGNGVYLGDNYKKIIKSVFIGEENIPKELIGKYNYFTDPSEFSSYIGTNLKDELVKKGLINSVHDKVSYNILKNAEGNIPILDKYIPFIKNRNDFVKLINITPYGIGAIGSVNILDEKK